MALMKSLFETTFGVKIMTDAPVVEVAEAVAETIASHSPEQIIADITLATTLVKQLKDQLSGAHPAILDLIKAWF